MKCPCTKDCPNRCCGCAVNCKPYKDYCDWREENVYKPRQREHAANDVLMDVFKENQRKLAKTSREAHRH